MAAIAIHTFFGIDIIMLLTDLLKDIPCALLKSSREGRLSANVRKNSSRDPGKIPTHKVLPKTIIESVVTDSRKVTRGSLFLAIKGTQADGHAFLNDVIKKNPSAIVVEAGRNISARVLRSGIPVLVVESTRRLSSQLADRWFDQPTRYLNIFGVTGTNGKTTTTQMLATLLGAKEQSGFLSTVAYRYADVYGDSDMTTPDPWALHSRFREMVDRGVKSCVIEVSSHALDQCRVNDIRFRRNIFTNLTQDHLDYHKTIERYFRAKQKLFMELRAAEDPLINIDDAYGRRLIKQLKNRAVSYGIDKESADYVAEDIEMSLDKTKFVLRTPHGSEEISLPLLGKHNVYNFLAASATAVEEGMPIKELVERVRMITAVSGRLEPIQEGQRYKIFVDYAHTPDAIERILSFLGSLTNGKLITVFGCGGDRDRTKRPKMGRAAEKWSDVVIVTADNPRSESVDDIIKEIGASRKGSVKTRWIEIPNRRNAIREALSLAQDEDVVAVLGKGHERVQLIGNKRLTFSDQEVIREELRLREYALH